MHVDFRASELELLRPLPGLDLRRPNTLGSQTKALDLPLDVMPIVDLSRSSSFSRQRHHMSLGHGSWGLVGQVLDRHWESHFTWSGSSYSAARAFEGRKNRAILAMP